MPSDQETDLRDAIQFHGHLCPGLALGYRVAKAALREQKAERPHDEELVDYSLARLVHVLCDTVARWRVKVQKNSAKPWQVACVLPEQACRAINGDCRRPRLYACAPIGRETSSQDPSPAWTLRPVARAISRHAADR